MFSNYKVQFAKKVSHAKPHTEAFNLEKEAKIINPHEMDLKTTMMNVFQGRQGQKAQSCKKQDRRQDGPILLNSDYRMKYPNWQNGNHDHFIEKKPQFPVYQLPFRAITTNQRELTSDKID